VPQGYKYIYDPIHGSITLRGATLDAMSHPLLQRLWGVRQTGMAHLIFPGAGHSRLEHSLGVLWVARSMAEALGLDEDVIRTIELAGLLHDIGHTPFSHSLEGALVEVTGANHEKRGVELITHDPPHGFLRFGKGIPGYEPLALPDLLSRHGVDAWEVAGLLQSSRTNRKTKFIEEMLHGPIDADRLDYLERDAHYTGVAHGAIDSNRLMETLRTSDGHLAFAEKGRSAVEGFLVARSLMYASVYYNKTVRIAESMILSAVERVPGYPEAARELLAMTDGELLSALELVDERAREMVMRLKVRALYKRAFAVGEDDTLEKWERLARNPQERRQLEDELAATVHAKPGQVLVDIITMTNPPGEDVTIVEEGTPHKLLEEDPYLAHLVRRSPTRWKVGIYTIPKLRGEVQRRGKKALEKLL
jgi:hypothetical protein